MHCTTPYTSIPDDLQVLLNGMLQKVKASNEREPGDILIKLTENVHIVTVN
jgi:hypothetical protein